MGFATKHASAAGVASNTATALARGVLHTMMISKSMDVDAMRVGHGSHLYLFQNRIGKWVDIDTYAILDASQGKKKAAAKN